MPYTPDATDVTNPIAGTVKAATAAAEFIAIKLYIRDVLLAGISGKASLVNPAFSGLVTVTGALSGAALQVLRLQNNATGVSTKAQIAFYTAGGTNYGNIQAGYGAATPEMNFVLPSGTQGVFTWVDSGVERARIDANGNVGIGASSPTSKLHVNGSLALSLPTYVSSPTYAVGPIDSCLRVAVGCTLTLPVASSFLGRILRIANVGAVAVNSASNNVAQPNTGIADNALLPATAGKWADIQSDGSLWCVTASN